MALLGFERYFQTDNIRESVVRHYLAENPSEIFFVRFGAYAPGNRFINRFNDSNSMGRVHKVSDAVEKKERVVSGDVFRISPYWVDRTTGERGRLLSIDSMNGASLFRVKVVVMNEFAPVWLTAVRGKGGWKTVGGGPAGFDHPKLYSLGNRREGLSIPVDSIRTLTPPLKQRVFRSK